jgi:hypothetical protein
VVQGRSNSSLKCQARRGVRRLWLSPRKRSALFVRFFESPCLLAPLGGGGDPPCNLIRAGHRP